MGTTCLTVCPDCNRHLRCGERACPFCGAGVSSFFRVLEYRLKTRLSRGRGFSLGAALTAVGIATCSNDIGCAVYGGPCLDTASCENSGGSAGWGGAAGSAGTAGGAGHVGGNATTAGSNQGGTGTSGTSGTDDAGDGGQMTSRAGAGGDSNGAAGEGGTGGTAGDLNGGDGGQR